MEKNNIMIRLEKKEEHQKVENLVRESFWNVYRPGCLEHYVLHQLRNDPAFVPELDFATVYKGNIIKNLIMDCQSYTKYRPNETTGGIFVSWRRKEELPTGA